MIRQQRGFTLIEIMVVMVIVGVMVGMISLVATGSRDRQELENESRRLMAVLQMASEEAVLQNIEIGVEFSEEGYRFRGFDEENRQWIRMPQEFLSDEELEEGIELDLTGLAVGMSLKQTNERATEDEESRTEFLPQVLLLSSGETTPFDIDVSSPVLEGIRYRISSDGFNPLVLEVPEDD